MLCVYSEAYIVVKRKITVKDDDNADRRNKNLILKNNTGFRSWISKSNTLIGNAEDLGIVMLMNNLLQYNDNHSMISQSC